MMRTLILSAALTSAAMTLPAIAQDAKAPAMTTDTKAPAPAANAASTQNTNSSLALSSQEAKTWIGKPVYSSDGKNLGDVAAFQRADDNKVSEMRADIGGFLGIGEHRISLTPEQFTLKTDRVVLDLTAAQAKALPKVVK